MSSTHDTHSSTSTAEPTGSSRRKKYSPTKRLLVPSASDSGELVAVEQSMLCTTEPSVSSVLPSASVATPMTQSRARRRVAPNRTSQKSTSLMSNDSGFLSDDSMSTSLNETLQKLVTSACSTTNGVKQGPGSTADSTATVPPPAMGMLTPEMLCDLMKTSLPLYQAMLALAQQQQQNGK
ncbi:hypothetical protein AAVH_41072, partial [Aphelenchoides avenae]